MLTDAAVRLHPDADMAALEAVVKSEFGAKDLVIRGNILIFSADDQQIRSLEVTVRDAQEGVLAEVLELRTDNDTVLGKAGLVALEELCASPGRHAPFGMHEWEANQLQREWEAEGPARIRAEARFAIFRKPID